MEDNKNLIRSAIVDRLNGKTEDNKIRNDKNPIRGAIVDRLNGKTEDNTNIYYEKLNDFKNMIKDSKEMEEIKSDNKLKNIVLDIYNLIKDNYISEL